MNSGEFRNRRSGETACGTPDRRKPSSPPGGAGFFSQDEGKLWSPAVRYQSFTLPSKARLAALLPRSLAGYSSAALSASSTPMPGASGMIMQPSL